jgi:hypothetical protein
MTGAPDAVAILHLGIASAGYVHQADLVQAQNAHQNPWCDAGDLKMQLTVRRGAHQPPALVETSQCPTAISCSGFPRWGWRTSRALNFCGYWQRHQTRGWHHSQEGRRPAEVTPLTGPRPAIQQPRVIENAARCVFRVDRDKAGARGQTATLVVARVFPATRKAAPIPWQTRQVRQPCR